MRQRLEFTTSSKAPKAIGHYSQAVGYGHLLFTAGQLPIDPATNQPVTDSIEAQVRQVLTNLKHVVEAAGGELSSIVKTTVYLSDLSLAPRVNTAYAEFFGDHKPARSTIPVGPFFNGMQVEIEAVAALPVQTG